MGCNCRNKNTEAQQALKAQKAAEGRRRTIREAHAKQQAKANAAK